MATFHLSMKQISRAAGRSATAAAAYRAGVEIIDTRTGLVHDYRRRTGVLYSQLILPSDGSANRAEFWNRIEAHHRRGDAVLAREIEVSLPAELSCNARQALAVNYARELAQRYGVAVDVALHGPGKGGDARNYHAHLLLTACAVRQDGALGRKVIELDPLACQKRGPGREACSPPADRERPRWQELVNQALAAAGSVSRVDHRSHEARGLEGAPGIHIGPASTQLERAGIRTRLGNVNRRLELQNKRLRDEQLKLTAPQTRLDEEPAAEHGRRRPLQRRARLQNERPPRPSRNNGPRGPR